MSDSPEDIDASIYSGKAPVGSNEPTLPNSRWERPGHSISSLRLDVESAMAGKTELLLPEGFRDSPCGRTYPLPTNRADLQIVATIPVIHRNDTGSIYIRRAVNAWRKRLRTMSSALHDTDNKAAKVKNSQDDFVRTTRELKAKMHEITASVQIEANKAIASLNDLFALGRETIEGQLKAHIAGTEWMGEKITARAARECFRMVFQAVKGLGLPSDQHDKARDAVMEEVAKSLDATRSAISGDTSDEGETH